MDAKKKRRRYGGGLAGAIRLPPGRLGWLGEGMQLPTTTFATTTTGNDDDDDGNNMNGDDGHRHDADGEAICALTAPAKRAGVNSDYDVATTTNTIDLTDENDVEDLREINHRTESERGGEQEIEIEIATMEHDDDNDNAAKTNGWVCRACTLINPDHVSSCEACNTAKRVAGGGGSLPNRRHRNQQFRSTSSFKSTRILSSTATTTIGTKRLVAEVEVQPNDINCSTMWIDKYAPRTSQELCVAPKKVEQVRCFLSSYMDYLRDSRRRQQPCGTSRMDMISINNNHSSSSISNYIVNPPPETKLMILIGNPGVGKSAMVRTLAREMNLQILSWNDAHVEYNNNNNNNNNNISYRHQLDDSLGSSSGYYDTLPYQSQLNSFDEFLTMSGVGMHSLDVRGGGEFLDATLALAATTAATVDLPRGRNGRSHKQPKTNKVAKPNKRRSDDFVGSVILVEEVSFRR
jgi:hypothetical protein